MRHIFIRRVCSFCICGHPRVIFKTPRPRRERGRLIVKQVIYYANVQLNNEHIASYTRRIVCNKVCGIFAFVLNQKLYENVAEASGKSLETSRFYEM